MCGERAGVTGAGRQNGSAAFVTGTSQDITAAQSLVLAGEKSESVMPSSFHRLPSFERLRG